MVRKGGLEPPWSCDRQPLKLVRLPISPLPLSKTVKSAMNCRFLRNQSELLNLPLKWVGWHRGRGRRFLRLGWRGALRRIPQHGIGAALVAQTESVTEVTRKIA